MDEGQSLTQINLHRTRADVFFVLDMYLHPLCTIAMGQLSFSRVLMKVEQRYVIGFFIYSNEPRHIQFQDNYSHKPKRTAAVKN